jgi:putative phosphoribosyl transferase
MAVKQMGAAKVVVTAPIASSHAVERLSKVADAVVVLHEDPEFEAVGRYYQTFSQTTDEEVLELLKAVHPA